LGSFLLTKQSKFWDFFIHGKSFELLETKKGTNATFWAIFSQTHLVTLAEVEFRPTVQSEEGPSPLIGLAKVLIRKKSQMHF
jgi:hypothetical protein